MAVVSGAAREVAAPGNRRRGIALEPALAMQREEVAADGIVLHFQGLRDHAGRAAILEEPVILRHEPEDLALAAGQRFSVSNWCPQFCKIRRYQAGPRRRGWPRRVLRRSNAGSAASAASGASAAPARAR